MPEIIVWPRSLLAPRDARFNPAPASRGGAPTLGGVARTIRTDRGFWRGSLVAIPVGTYDQRRAWNAIRVALGGRPGLCAVPVYAHDTAPYELVAGARAVPEGIVLSHSDGTYFSDGTGYVQGSIAVRMHAAAALGDTVVQLELLAGEADLAGVRFSYRHALYETGPASDVTGAVWTVPVVPRIRAPIAAGEDLEFDHPTCLAHLARDDGMDIDFPREVVSRPSVDWVEATDYWADLAAGLI